VRHQNTFSLHRFLDVDNNNNDNNNNNSNNNNTLFLKNACHASLNACYNTQVKT